MRASLSKSKETYIAKETFLHSKRDLKYLFLNFSFDFTCKQAQARMRASLRKSKRERLMAFIERAYRGSVVQTLVCVSLSLYVCMCVCMYTHIERLMAFIERAYRGSVV